MPRGSCCSAPASRLRAGLLALGFALVGGCAGEDWCESPVEFLYDPSKGAVAGALPDDFHRRDGRLRLDDETAPWLAELPSDFAATYRELSGLDGWGLTAPVALRFNAPLAPLRRLAPAGPGAVPGPADAVQLLELADGEPARRVPVELRLSDEDRTLFATPLVPLRPQTRHVLAVTRGALDAEGRCIAPGAHLRSRLESAGSDDVLVQALERAGLARSRVSAATVFTTQSLGADGAAIAADVRARGVARTSAPACTDSASQRTCSFRFKARDYRSAAPAQAPELELTAHAWLPRGFDGPRPFVLYGHGLSDSHLQAESFARELNKIGIAVVATSAPCHGDHPGAPADPIKTVVCFTALFDPGPVLKSGKVRDHIRLAVYERLQLLALLESDADVDADGARDLDFSRVAYMGSSLGGIMGVELVAQYDRFGAAVLLVTGGPVASQIVRTSPGFEALMIALRAEASDAEVQRLLAAAQVVFDPGDPVAHAPRLLARRGDAGGPHVLMVMVEGDRTIPNSATYALARAIGVERAGRFALPEPLLGDRVPPFAANGPGGRTAGLFVMDRFTSEPGGVPIAAEHATVRTSLEVARITTHFLGQWSEGRAPEVIDPYEALGTPPLQP